MHKERIKCKNTLYIYMYFLYDIIYNNLES